MRCSQYLAGFAVKTGRLHQRRVNRAEEILRSGCRLQIGEHTTDEGRSTEVDVCGYRFDVQVLS